MAGVNTSLHFFIHFKPEVFFKLKYTHDMGDSPGGKSDESSGSNTEEPRVGAETASEDSSSTPNSQESKKSASPAQPSSANTTNVTQGSLQMIYFICIVPNTFFYVIRKREIVIFPQSQRYCCSSPGAWRWYHNSDKRSRTSTN